MSTLTASPIIRETEMNGETFLQLDPTTTLVKSQSEAGVWYTVTYWKGQPYACTCKGFEYRGKCRHVEALKGESKPACDGCGCPTSALIQYGKRLCMRCAD